MFMRTQSLLLRPGWPDDLEELVALTNDETVARNIGPWPLPRTVEDARAFLERPWDKRLPTFFIGLRKDDGLSLVGCICLGRIEGQTELGYWIGRAYRNRGLAGEAARAVVNHAWVLGHERIVAAHFADNEAAGRVLDNAGFHFTGEVRMRFCHHRGHEVPAHVYVAQRPAKPTAIPSVGADEAASCFV